MACDLHTHSVFSDGTCTPAEILDEAEALGLSAVALTDHNAVNGLPDLMAAAEGRRLTVIPGVEISTDYCKPDGSKTELHLVALFVRADQYDTVMVKVGEMMRRKEESNQRLVEGLRAAGYQLDYGELKRSTAGGFVNRAVVAASLMEKGYVSSIDEAFARLLSPKHGFYEPPKRLDVFEVIRFIREIGAVSVLAHPFLNLSGEELEAFLEKAAPAGLDAMEVYYSTYDDEQTALAAELVGRYGLLPSGGSDYHGRNKPDIALGSGKGNLRVPDEWWKALEKLAEERL